MIFIVLQNVYVHLAVECLEQLQIRELHEVFPLENELFGNSQQKDEKKRINVANIISSSSDSLLENKVRVLLEKKRNSFTRADKLRLVALTALSCGGLDQDVLKNLLLSADLIDKRYPVTNYNYQFTSIEFNNRNSRYFPFNEIYFQDKRQA